MPADEHLDERPPTAEETDGEQQLKDASGHQPPADELGRELAEAIGDQPDPAAELATAKDQVLRLQAEMDNLRKRTSKEIQTERQYGAMELMRELLPVVDNINRAIEAAQQTSDAEGLLEGFRLVQQQLMTVLDHHHCELIEAEGEVFNPDFHEAILQQPSTEHPAHSVVMVTQTGYKLHDRVIRPAQVIVSSGPPAE